MIEKPSITFLNYLQNLTKEKNPQNPPPSKNIPGKILKLHPQLQQTTIFISF
jgi:hypothetical protein